MHLDPAGAPDFIAKLRDVVEGTAPDARKSTREALDSVLRAGGTSYARLLAIVRNHLADLDTRYAACWFLGRLGSKRAVPALLIALRDRDAQLRAEAARELGYLGSTKAALGLTASLRSDSSVEVRKAAAYALGHLRDERALEALVGTLSNAGESPDVRGMAAEQLASFRDERTVGPLIRALRDSSAEVRFWAAYALGALGSPEALPELERLAETDDTVVTGWWSVKKEANDAITLIRSHSTDTSGQ